MARNIATTLESREFACLDGVRRMNHSFRSIKFHKLYKSEQYAPLAVSMLQSQKSKLEIPD